MRFTSGAEILRPKQKYSMALPKIIDRIKKEAEEKTGEIIAQAEVQAREFQEKSAAEVEAEINTLRDKGKAEINLQQSRKMQLAELRSRQELLAEKQRLMESAFQKAQKKLANLETKEYHEMLKGLILTYPLEGDEEVIISAADERRLTKESLNPHKWIKELNQQLEKRKGRGKLKLVAQSEPGQLRGGGFILKRGKVEANYSFASILSSLRQDLEPEIARILFPQN